MRKMLALAIVCSMAAIVASFDLCTKKDMCACNELRTEANCTCSSKNETQRSFHFVSMEEKKLLSIRDCEYVELTLDSFVNRRVDVMEIANVANLSLGQSVRFDTSFKRFSVENSRIDAINFKLFSNVYQIEAIEFRNVTIGTIKEKAFHSIKNVSTISFIDCTIDTIESNALDDVVNVDKFSIVDSSIQDIKPDAITLTDVEQFVLQKTVIGQMGKKAINLNSVNSTTVENCQIELMGENSIVLTASSNVFFNENKVKNVTTNGLGGMANVEKLDFRHNKIQAIDVTSMYVFRGNPKTDLTVINNFFTCYHHLCMALNDVQRTIAESKSATIKENYCEGTNMSLHDFWKLECNVSAPSMEPVSENSQDVENTTAFRGRELGSSDEDDTSGHVSKEDTLDESNTTSGSMGGGKSASDPQQKPNEESRNFSPTIKSKMNFTLLSIIIIFLRYE